MPTVEFYELVTYDMRHYFEAMHFLTCPGWQINEKYADPKQIDMMRFELMVIDGDGDDLKND